MTPSSAEDQEKGATSSSFRKEKNAVLEQNDGLNADNDSALSSGGPSSSGLVIAGSSHEFMPLPGAPDLEGPQPVLAESKLVSSATRGKEGDTVHSKKMGGMPLKQENDMHLESDNEVPDPDRDLTLSSKDPSTSGLLVLANSTHEAEETQKRMPSSKVELMKKAKPHTGSAKKKSSTKPTERQPKRKRSTSKKRVSFSPGSLPKRPRKRSRAPAGSGAPRRRPASPPDPDRPQGAWGARAPLEVLHAVFAEVARASGGAVPALVRLCRVCRLWRDAALSPHLWRVVDLGEGRTKQKCRTEPRLRWLLEHRLTRVQDLSLAGWHKVVTADALSAVCAGCPELRALSLASCRRVTPQLVQLVARQAAGLRALDLSAVNPLSGTSQAPVAAQCLQEVVRLAGPRLTELTLAHNCVVGLQLVVNVLADGCPNLEVLDMSNVLNNNRDIAPLSAERLQAGCPRLRVLRFTNTEIRLAFAPLEEQMASPGFPALEELSVAVPKHASWGVNDADLARLVGASRRLRLLDVRGCACVSSAGLNRLPAAGMQHLFISGCAAAAAAHGLEPLMARWRHSLLELDLSWAGHQSEVDGALRELAAPEAERWPPPPLRRLDLRGAPCSLSAVRQLVAACPRLGELDLTSCRSLPRGIKRLHRGAEVAALRDVVQSGRPAPGRGASP